MSQGANMFTLKTKVVGAILAASMVFASAASAMTLAEYKALERPKRTIYMTGLIVKEIHTAKITDRLKGECLERQFLTVVTNKNGIPDGLDFIGRQIHKSFKKDPHGRQIEDLVTRSAKYIAKKS